MKQFGHKLNENIPVQRWILLALGSCCIFANAGSSELETVQESRQPAAQAKEIKKPGNIRVSLPGARTGIGSSLDIFTGMKYDGRKVDKNYLKPSGPSLPGKSLNKPLKELGLIYSCEDLSY